MSEDFIESFKIGLIIGFSEALIGESILDLIEEEEVSE